MKLARLVAVAVLCVSALAFAAPAFAAESPAQQVYGGPCASDETSCEPLHTTTLPFTGINTVAIVALGMGLVGTGLVVRLRLRSSNN